MKTSGVVCPVCNSNDIRPYTKKNGYNIFLCQACKLLFVFPLDKIININQTVYNKQYFIKEKVENNFGYSNYDDDKKPMVKTYNHYLECLEKFLPNRGKLIDIGTATGFFLNLAKIRGWEPLGAEISEYAAEIGRRHGLNIVQGTIKDFLDRPESFEAITYFDVFEHIFEPVKELADIYSILKPGGFLAINTPDAGSVMARLTGKSWYSLLPPEHVILYRPQNLKQLLEANGFEVVLIKKIGKHFTLQYIFQIFANWIKVDIFFKIANLFDRKRLNRLMIPLNVRDNFLIIAQKNKKI